MTENRPGDLSLDIFPVSKGEAFQARSVPPVQNVRRENRMMGPRSIWNRELEMEPDAETCRPDKDGKRQKPGGQCVVESKVS